MPVDRFKAEYVSKEFEIDRRKEPYEAFGKLFYPQYNREGKYIYHHSKLRGDLVAKINLQGVLSIENSLHKFFHNNNFTDFTLSEVQTSIKQIEDLLKIPSDEFRLKKIELGLNLINDGQFYEQFGQYKMSGYENMRSGKKIYGRKFYLTDFNIKAYDKYLETKLNPNSIMVSDMGVIVSKNLNRLEIEFKRMRELNRCGLIMLSDLMNKDIMERAINRVLEKFSAVEINKSYDYSLISSRERELLFAGRNPDFWAMEKINNKNTYKKKRSTYRDCIKMLDKSLKEQDDLKIIMIQALTNKADFLLSN